MTKKKTTVKLTTATQVMITILIKYMDIPRTTFHRRAIDYLIENDVKMIPQLLIREWNDPHYVKKEAAEQIYIDDARKNILQQIAEKNDCGWTVVVCNALMVYCSVVAPVVLGEEKLEKLFPKK